MSTPIDASMPVDLQQAALDGLYYELDELDEAQLLLGKHGGMGRKLQLLLTKIGLGGLLGKENVARALTDRKAEVKTMLKSLHAPLAHKKLGMKSESEYTDEKIKVKGYLAEISSKMATAPKKELNFLRAELRGLQFDLERIDHSIRTLHTTQQQREVCEKTMQELPETQEEIPKDFAAIPTEVLENLVKTETAELPELKGIKDGRQFYRNVLNELDRFKDKLGGSPVFKSKKPNMDPNDNRKTFMGVSLAAVKDWFRMVLDKEWKPAFFWKTVAKMFGVSAETKMSQYEDVYLRIQRFGMCGANKDRLFQILDSGNKTAFKEMYQLSGLMWHASDNPAAVEKDFLNLIDLYFTKYFEVAKQKGDAALMEFFNALTGVCFEARCRNIHAYILKNPLPDVQGVAAISDWNTGAPVKEAYEKELMALALALKTSPTPAQLRERLTEKGVFEEGFLEATGRQKPTLEGFHSYALRQVAAIVLNPYSKEDFLDTEYKIFAVSGKEQTKENFIAQLQDRIDTVGEIELEGDTTFSLDDDFTKEFIATKFPKE